LNLPAIDEKVEKKGIRFDTAVASLLGEAYVEVEALQLIPSQGIESDIHSQYFASDRRVFSSVGMEDANGGTERFAAWMCSGPKGETSR